MGIGNLNNNFGKLTAYTAVNNNSKKADSTVNFQQESAVKELKLAQNLYDISDEELIEIYEGKDKNNPQKAKGKKGGGLFSWIRNLFDKVKKIFTVYDSPDNGKVTVTPYYSSRNGGSAGVTVKWTI